jgi:hypothetical protein
LHSVQKDDFDMVTEELISNAVRNDYGADAVFTLGDRTFPVKDLSYDDYIEFVRLARPIITGAVAGFDLMSGDFNPMAIDYEDLLSLAGKELPKMAWLCCRASDAKITIDQVKALARRPYPLIDVVLVQVKHNQMVAELKDFFPVVVKRLMELAPEVQGAMESVTTSVSTTEETPSVS